jgi:hypothetical protein
MLRRLAIEAYFGTEKETECHFINKRRYSLEIMICGAETLKIADRSTQEINVMLGVDKDLSFDLK